MDERLLTHEGRWQHAVDPDRNIKDNYGSVILIGSGPSIHGHMKDLTRTNMPKFCMNNAIKVYNNPDFWCATDVHAPNVFPPWIWGHGCYKFMPDPKGGISKYIPDTATTRTYLSRISGITTNYHHIDVEYIYDKETFLTSRKCQLGYAWRDNIIQSVNGTEIRSTTSTFLLAFKLCIDLGFRTIYLVGVDLSVPPVNFYAYDTNRKLTRSQIERETARMRMIHSVMSEQVEYLDKHQIKVWNCNPSGNASMFQSRGFIRPRILPPEPAPPPPSGPTPYQKGTSAKSTNAIIVR